MQNKYTVLIVDDAKNNIDLMSDMLKDSYNIITADSGSKALDLMRAEDSRPDVVLLDMLMPKPDGYDVLQEMSRSEELRSIPVVVVTSDSDPNAQSRSYELGAVDFVPRGADMNIVRSRVKSVVRLCELDKMRRENERLRHEITLERQLSALMDNLPGGVATIRTNGVTAMCTYCNTKLPELFRMTEEQFIMQFAMPVLPDWIKTFTKNAGECDRFTTEFAVETQDGSQWIRLTANGIGERGTMREMHCVFLDINSEKKQELRAEETERKLRDSKRQLETLVDNSPGGIVFAERGFTSERFKTLFVNQGLADMLGYKTREECLSALTLDNCRGVSEQDISSIKDELSRSPDYGRFFQYSFKCSGSNGDVWLKMNCQLVLGEDGKHKLYAFVTNLTNEKRFQDELRSVAFYDPLTSLYNRLAFIRGARRVLDSNPLTQYSLMALNIGSFKVVNDLLGREVGDKVLITIANSLRGLLEHDGVFGRLFGDNFAILTPYSERGVHPRTLLETIQKAVANSGLVSHEIQYYLGVYTIFDSKLSIESMIDRAFIACRSINGSYQEHIAYYDEKMRLKMLEDQEICDESPSALRNDEFCVYYQPVYGVRTGKFVSAEALVRWNRPRKGMVSPGKFVPVFEKNGFIAELDVYVLEQVCKLMKKRRDAGLPDFPISVNISRMSLYDPNLFETISEITDRYGIEPKYFRIEITESAYNDNPAQLLETIGKMRAKGYPVLMDDFGSGYSSLNTLKDIPIDLLKLDMKFMQGFEKNVRVGTIVTSVARMAKWLNIPMLAEGVETKEQFEFLASVGCSYIQGFYFSRPVPEEEFARLISSQDEIVGDSLEIRHDLLGSEINELLGSSELVSRLINGAFGGFGIYEMYDGKLEAVRVNHGYAQIKGYTTDEISFGHINVWDSMLPGDAEKSRGACLEALRTDKAVRATIRTKDKDGRTLYLDGIHRRLGGTDEAPIFCIAFNDITDQVEFENQVQRTNDRLEEILKAADALVVDFDYGSKKLLKFGNMSDYYLGTGLIMHNDELDFPFDKAVHPDDLEKAKAYYSDPVKGRKSQELRLLRKTDSKYVWWRVTEIPTYDGDGNLQHVMGIATNIDYEKRAKIQLDEERVFMKSIIENHFTGILIMEVKNKNELNHIYTNDSFWRIVGREKCSLNNNIFKESWFGIDENDRDDLRNAIVKRGDKPLRHTTEITRENGERVALELYIRLLPRRYEDTDLKAYSVFITEVGRTKGTGNE